MRQTGKLEKQRFDGGFIEVFRKISTIFLILNLCGAVAAQAELEPVSELYKARKYKEVVKVLKGKKTKEGEVFSYKDYAFLIKSYHHLGNINAQLSVLQNAILDHPKKDIFKREKARALEQKSNAYVDTKPYREMKRKLKIEAFRILNDLYTKNPTKENFTALVAYYNREKNYDEALGLLELYARDNKKGRIYYTYLCEAQYQAKMYATSKETCGWLKTKYPNSEKGHIFFGMSLKKIGAEAEAEKSFVKVVSRFPASSSIQYEAGKALIKEGKRKEGLVHLEKHLEMEPTDDALLLKATTLFGLRQYDDALKSFVEACKTRTKRKKPLLAEFRKAAANFQKRTENRTRYEKEIKRCKYIYGVKKKVPRGLLGGGYSN